MHLLVRYKVDGLLVLPEKKAQKLYNLLQRKVEKRELPQKNVLEWITVLGDLSFNAVEVSGQLFGITLFFEDDPDGARLLISLLEELEDDLGGDNSLRIIINKFYEHYYDIKRKLEQTNIYCNKEVLLHLNRLQRVRLGFKLAELRDAYEGMIPQSVVEYISNFQTSLDDPGAYSDDIAYRFRNDPEGLVFLIRLFVDAFETFVSCYSEDFTADCLPAYEHFLERLTYYQELWSKS